MAGREWAAGDDFSLADCGAAPFLFYADWTHRIDPAFGNVVAYRKRLLARPSFTRAVDDARPYRSLFPIGAPDRDCRQPAGAFASETNVRITSETVRWTATERCRCRAVGPTPTRLVEPWMAYF